MRILLIASLIGIGFILLVVNNSLRQPVTEARNQAVNLVLAASWQPAFCEKHRRKPECRSQSSERFDAGSFSLHGLWSQPRGRIYCNVPSEDRAVDKAGKWANIKPLQLSQALRQELKQKMPGYQSFLHRHEWIKHGTCLLGLSEEAYFQTSLKLLDELNKSTVRDLFATNIGNEIDSSMIRRAMDKSFGNGAGDRLKVACRQDGSRRIITELTIGLTGTIENNLDMASLISNASPTDAGCPGGIVDAVGYQ